MGILRKEAIDRKRSYESMDSLRSTPTREMNFKRDYTPTNTNTTYFCANYPFTEKEKSQMQMLSPSQPRPILSLRGTEYNPNLSNTSKFSSKLEHASNYSKT